MSSCELMTRPCGSGGVTAAFQARTEAVWGEALSPEEVVSRILEDVKAREILPIEYAGKLDGAQLTPTASGLLRKNGRLLWASCR